jgi:hypothetical protein
MASPGCDITSFGKHTPVFYQNQRFTFLKKIIPVIELFFFSRRIFKKKLVVNMTLYPKTLFPSPGNREIPVLNAMVVRTMGEGVNRDCRADGRIKPISILSSSFRTLVL